MNRFEPGDETDLIEVVRATRSPDGNMVTPEARFTGRRVEVQHPGDETRFTTELGGVAFAVMEDLQGNRQMMMAIDHADGTSMVAIFTPADVLGVLQLLAKAGAAMAHGGDLQ